MNDDRKFQERAETMKELFLARIPTDVIAEVAGVSSATVTNDRVRVAKLYGINIPNAATTASERIERFRLLFKTFLEVKFESHTWRSSLYQAANLLIDFDRIDNHFSSLENFWEGLQKPQFVSENPITKNYQQLIEDCYSTECQNFSSRFYKAVYDGIIPHDRISNEDDIINLSTEFCCKVDRSCLNTLVINNPKAVLEPLLSLLNETQAKVINGYYGLGCEKKTLEEISNELNLTRERIRQIREKSFRIIRNALNEKKYLFHSTAKYNHLEQQYAELEKKYSNYCKETDNRILELNCKIQELKGFYEENGESFDFSDHPLRIQILITPIKEARFSKRIHNAVLSYDYEYIIDIIENWDKLLQCRNFGKKSLGEIINYLETYDIDIKELTIEEKVLARQMIRRLKASQT